MVSYYEVRVILETLISCMFVFITTLLVAQKEKGAALAEGGWFRIGCCFFG